jgi:antitoxin VapB
MSAVQIANPVVVRKIEWLANSMKLGKTAVIDRAMDVLTAQWLREVHSQTPEFISTQQRLQTLLTQLDNIADQPQTTAALDWDANGLPT